jgi:dTMP kinase
MANGFFIALEGIDGAGTTTQLRRLGEALWQRGYTVTTTVEPSDGPVGVLLRQALTAGWPASEGTLALLFAADRLHHVQHTIAPALRRGEVVLCDRYVMSSYAYQSTALPDDWVRSVNAEAPAPDAHLFFRVDPEIAGQRRASRGEAPERFDAATRQAQVAAAYEKLATGPHALRGVHTIDANQSAGAVTAAATTLILKLLQEAQSTPAGAPPCP